MTRWVESGSEAFDSVLRAAQADAGWAYTRLYRSISPAVYGYFRLQGCADAEDLTSEVFLSAFSAIRSFTGTEPQFRSWVFTIAHRRLVDDRRRWGRRPLVTDHSPEALNGAAAVDDVEGDALRHLSEERVRRLCRALAPDQRDVLLLRIISGLTVDEVASALGKTAGAVKALQRRGLLSIRREIEREGVPL